MNNRGRKNRGKGLDRRELLKYGLYGGLAWGVSTGLGLAGCSPKRSTRPNIILITLDTTRADRLGCYGYDRNTSPHIDRLANNSQVYARAVSPSSWTLPAHASLFTGKFTTSHGARKDSEGPLRLLDAIEGPEMWNVYRARGLAHNERTLASMLGGSGFATGAVVGGPWMKRVFGLDKGFQHYDDTHIDSVNGRLAENLTHAALKWIRKNRRKEFFLFLNYFDPHAPYSPPGEYARAFLPEEAHGRDKPSLEEINALYDGEILYMDHYLGTLLDQLRSWDLYDNTFLIVTSDHGELLGEHGLIGHGKHLTEQELHVPLLMKYPRNEVSPGRSDARVQLNDIFAMILDRLGIPVPSNAQAGSPPAVGHPVLAEVYPLPGVGRDAGDWRAIYEDDLKFVWNSKGNHQVFNLKTDL